MRYFYRLDQFAARVAGHAVVKAVRKGMLYMIPLTLIGSIALMLLNLPLPAFQSAMNTVFGEHWRTVLLYTYNGTFQIMSVTALISVSYCYAGENDLVKSGEVSQVSVILTTVAAFIAYCGVTDQVITVAQSSSTGLFRALILAVITTKLFLWLCHFDHFRPKIIANDIDVVLRASLNTVVPALLTVFALGLGRVIISYVGIVEWCSIQYDRLTVWATGDGSNFLTVIAFIIVSHVLWFFGFHGTNILDGVADGLFVSAGDWNIALFAAGQTPTEIFTKEFLDTFVYMGGCGATLGLLIASMIISRKRFSLLERYSLLPAIFNINELLVYGIPVIFNPYLFLPFLLAPIIMAITAYAATAMSLVPMTIAHVEWTTPIFVSGYISTGSVAGVLLQAFNLALSIVIYLPFVKLYQKHLNRNSAAVFQNLTADIQYIRESRPKAVLNRSDEVGIHARYLAEDIASGLRGEIHCLHLEYQPKVDIDGVVVGAEALIRCTHPVYGRVSPLVILTVAEEAGLSNSLGQWIIRRALSDLHGWNQLGYSGLSLSINVDPQQLQTDSTLVSTALGRIRELGLDPRYVELELTENAAVDQSTTTHTCLEQFRQAGVGITIDDFGMGHSSLLYLRDLYANVVKIDQSLVASIATDQHSQHIVGSICSLCNQLGVGIVAEGTETFDQIHALSRLGCHVFQGFYYSPSLPFDQFIQFIQNHGARDLKNESNSTTIK